MIITLRHSLLTLLALCASSPLSAETEPNDTITLSGVISDAFTRENLVGVHLTVSDAAGYRDTASTVLIRGFQPEFDQRRYSVKVPRAGRYTLTLSKDGYATASHEIKVPARQYMKRVTWWNVPELLIRRSTTRTLSEATVTASRVMMVQRGDTIVYNASAFQLAEGSMLDALIGRLPGVKIDRNGRITINGQFVESLLVNGKDFFKGDPKVALDNLPAYMVQNVKAYQKASREAYLTPDRSAEERKQDPWVLDVNLKREYAQGWIANVEAGYGTDDRWLARLFGMRFTDHSRLALYGSANNTDDTAEPGRDGAWDEPASARGDVKTQRGGLMFQVDGKKTKISLNTSLRASHTDDNNLTRTGTTTFLQTQNVYGRSSSEITARRTDVKWDADLFMPFKRVAVTFRPDIRYGRYTSDGLTREGQWNVEPYESYRNSAVDSLFNNLITYPSLVYALSDHNRDTREQWNASGQLRLRFKSPLLGHQTIINLLGNIDHTDHTTFSRYDLRTAGTGAEELRNRFFDSPERGYQWQAHLQYYVLQKRGVNLLFLYQYSQQYQSDNRRLYRLDRLGNGWDKSDRLADGRPFGLLPSTHDSLTAATDWQNSYYTGLLTRKHRPELWLTLYGNWGSLNATLPLTHLRRDLRDHRYEQLDHRTRLTRRILAFEPSVSYSYKKLNVSYNRQLQPASLSSMLSVTDDSNPLYVYRGNAELKDAWQDNFSIGFTRSQAPKRQMLSLRGSLWTVSRAAGYARSYDETTGVTTVTPRNINGNWGANANIAFEQAAGKHKRVTLGTTTELNYNRSVDFLNDLTLPTGVYVRSTVNNYRLAETLKADYQQGSFYAGLRLGGEWNVLTSSRPGFSDINALDLQGALIVTTPLVWGIQLATDLTLYSRHGYELRAMNTDDFIWNASLSRAFLRSKRLIVKLSGYDILGQRSRITYDVNAQGRSETWTNSLRRYGMLHLIYRLNIEPKKR